MNERKTFILAWVTADEVVVAINIARLSMQDRCRGNNWQMVR